MLLLYNCPRHSATDFDTIASRLTALPCAACHWRSEHLEVAKLGKAGYQGEYHVMHALVNVSSCMWLWGLSQTDKEGVANPRHIHLQSSIADKVITEVLANQRWSCQRHTWSCAVLQRHGSVPL